MHILQLSASAYHFGCSVYSRPLPPDCYLRFSYTHLAAAQVQTGHCSATTPVMHDLTMVHAKQSAPTWFDQSRPCNPLLQACFWTFCNSLTSHHQSRCVLQGTEHLLTWVVGVHQVQVCHAHCHEQHPHGGLHGLEKHWSPF